MPTIYYKLLDVRMMMEEPQQDDSFVPETTAIANEDAEVASEPASVIRPIPNLLNA